MQVDDEQCAAGGRRVPQRGEGPQQLGLDITDAARGWLAEHGYDPIYGARPLRRLV
ncbi:hypothetical protein, partial [Micromonospora sp. NPDC023814]|uniref:hypothetical protein n=1 Tax=Micromonospora sp. NPDC023814 TaxID=3154596 RepID=UPI00340D90EF